MILSGTSPRMLIGLALYPRIVDAPPPPPPEPAETYPSLGRLLLAGFAERPESALLRTDMESGPPKVIKIRSRVMVSRPVAYLYTAEQYAGFKTWFRDTLSRGANWFEWVDPVDGQVKLARIQSAPGQPPYDASAYMAQEGAPPSWEVRMTIETWG